MRVELECQREKLRFKSFETRGNEGGKKREIKTEGNELTRERSERKIKLVNE